MQLLAVIAQKCSSTYTSTYIYNYGERNEQGIIIIITTMVSPIPSISHIERKNISWSVCSVLVSPSSGWCHAPLYCIRRGTCSSCTDTPSAWCQSGPCRQRKPLFLHNNYYIVICCKSCTYTHNIKIIERKEPTFQ